MRDAVWSMIAMVLALGLLLVLNGAVRVISPSVPLPDVVLQMVIFWSWYRPHALPAPMVLVLGLAQDALLGMPLGLHAVFLLLVQLALHARLRVLAERPFVVQWVAAMCLMALVVVVRGVFYEIYAQQSYLSWQAMQGWAMSTLTYPLMHWLCTGVYSCVVRWRSLSTTRS